MSERPVAWLVFDDVHGRFAAALRPPGVVIGRDPERCDVALRTFAISRQHAQIAVDASGAMVVEDLKSKGGTQVNQQPVVTAAVTIGDRLRLGTAKFEIVATPPPDARRIEPGAMRFVRRSGAKQAASSATSPASDPLPAGARPEPPTACEVRVSQSRTPVLALIVRPPSAMAGDIALDVHVVNPTDTLFEVRAEIPAWLRVEEGGGVEPLIELAPRSAIRVGGVLVWEMNAVRTYRIAFRRLGEPLWEERTVDLADRSCFGFIPIVGAFGSVPRMEPS